MLEPFVTNITVKSQLILIEYMSTKKYLAGFF